MNSRLLAVLMMTQFSFGTSWTVHPQRAHHSSSRTCSNSTLAPQHARTLTSQSNYGQWWLFQTPHNQGYISFYLQNFVLLAQIDVWFWTWDYPGVTHHIMSLCNFRITAFEIQENCSPVLKVIILVFITYNVQCALCIVDLFLRINGRGM